MPGNILLVKNMVCRRCMLAVENVLEKTFIKFQKVDVGEIHLAEAISNEQHNQLSSEFSAIGLELIDNKNTGLIEKIKQLVIKKARNEVEESEKKD